MTVPNVWHPLLPPPYADFAYGTPEGARVLVSVSNANAGMNEDLAFALAMSGKHDICGRFVEPIVNIEVINGEHGIGFCFQGTDSEYSGAADDWPYLFRCWYVVGSRGVIVTVLCGGPWAPTIAEARAMIMSAK